MIPSHLTRTAAVQIRGSTGPLWAHLYWPPPTTAAAPLLVYFPDRADGEVEAGIRQLCRSAGLILLAAATQYDLPDAEVAIGWAADHAAELEADPDRLLLAGTGRGAELAAEIHRIAAEDGWPDLTLFDLPEGTVR
jgi:hypothetical protein